MKKIVLILFIALFIIVPLSRSVQAEVEEITVSSYHLAQSVSEVEEEDSNSMLDTGLSVSQVGNNEFNVNSENQGEEDSDSRSYEISLTDEEGNSAGTMSIEHEGMVPCGRCLSSGKTYSERLDEIHGCQEDGETYVPCDMCHLFITFDNIIDFILIDIIPIIALFVIVLAGVMYITAAQNPDRTNKAKKAFLWAIGGVFIAYLAWAITTFFVGQFMDWDIEWGGGDGGIGVQQMCDLELPEDHPLDETEEEEGE